MIAALLALGLAGAQPGALDADALRACIREPDDRRLACFDAAMRGRTAAPAAASVGDDERAESTAAPRRAAPERREARGAPPATPVRPAEPTGLPRDVAVAALDLDRYGKARITLANGQVWRQIGSDSAVLRPSRRDAEAGLRASVRRAALGSHRMTIEPTGKTIRVRLQD